ncbi:MAG: ABC transporter ATP-binding protein [Actinomycetota bacterium]|nr:ABC transporter ATP-binding protein [Actinomycetota bacterium]
MLDLRDLTLTYGSTPAVTGLNLRIDEGEAVSLVGPNGAGKTTTLSAIAGQLKPNAGTITFRGESIIGRKPESLVRQGIALVPEGRQIFSTLTVGENLKLPTADLDRNRGTELIEAELKRFPALSTRLDDPAGGLSGGQQQMLAISRSLLCRPKLLLLDEPSLGLAPKIVDDVFDALNGLRKEGVTILLVEQNAIRASEFADRTYVLNAGKIVLEGTRAEMADADLLTESYLGAVQAEGATGTGPAGGAA